MTINISPLSARNEKNDLVTESNQNEVEDDRDPDALAQAVAKMTNRTPEQIAEAQAWAIATYKPQNPLPPDMSLFDAIAGKWPGNETDEQIAEALERLS